MRDLLYTVGAWLAMSFAPISVIMVLYLVYKGIIGASLSEAEKVSVLVIWFVVPFFGLVLMGASGKG